MNAVRPIAMTSPRSLIADKQAAAVAVPSAAQAARRKKSLNDRQKVGELVGNVFYGTLMKQMNSSSIKSPLMHGGRGEEVFGGQLTLELSKRMGHSANNPITDRMYRSILKHSGKTAAAGAAGEVRIRR